MDPLLVVETSDRRVEFGHDDLTSLATGEAARRAGDRGRGYTAVTFDVLSRSVGTSDDADHATFHAADGYAASIPLPEAVSDALLLVPAPGDGRTGVRLVVDGGRTGCVNVKAVTRVELRRGPGKHTVDPNPHDNAFVPGWDPEP